MIPLWQTLCMSFLLSFSTVFADATLTSLPSIELNAPGNSTTSPPSTELITTTGGADSPSLPPAELTSATVMPTTEYVTPSVTNGSTTAAPGGSTFDAPSFIGGIVLALAVVAIAALIYKLCKDSKQYNSL